MVIDVPVCFLNVKTGSTPALFVESLVIQHMMIEACVGRSCIGSQDHITLYHCKPSVYRPSPSSTTVLALKPSSTGGSLSDLAFLTTLTSAAFVSLRCCEVSISSSDP